MTDGDRKSVGQRRSEWFFGRRKSKALSPAQSRRFLNLMPKLGIDVSGDAPEPLSDLFAHSPKEVILEIGFGGGEHLVHQAKSFPENGYIGVEPFVNSMAKALREIENGSLSNIRLYDEDATELLDWMPESSVSRVDLLYPDPWPKQRHWKRRFVNADNLDRIARVLYPGGHFRFASDIESYVNWTLHAVHRHSGFFWRAKTSEDWSQPFENWTRTRYESKAIREGRTPCYLTFQRV